ncbi:MAG: hypothetical protein K6E99_02660 [Bacilli bacterium]|nr:hypothetical protein [Bacilli bacterium]
MEDKLYRINAALENIDLFETKYKKMIDKIDRKYKRFKLFEDILDEISFFLYNHRVVYSIISGLVASGLGYHLFSNTFFVIVFALVGGAVPVSLIEINDTISGILGDIREKNCDKLEEAKNNFKEIEEKRETLEDERYKIIDSIICPKEENEVTLDIKREEPIIDEVLSDSERHELIDNASILSNEVVVAGNMVLQAKPKTRTLTK